MDFREIIISQYLAALATLKQTILVCPETLWDSPGDHNNFSQIAYHALFFTHLYVQESEQAFSYWSGHREEYRFESDLPARPSEAATKAVVLEHLAFCQNQVVEKMSTMKLDAPSGFDWGPSTRFELQLYSIRHVQQNAGELMERLGTRASGINWVGTLRPAIDNRNPKREEA